jgi:DNA modification methylase
MDFLNSQMDLAEFIRRYAKPYDAETDDYRRPPFATPIKAKRSGTSYDAHSYHTKVPPDGIMDFIKHYTFEGDLVLDPFCGSGMTGVAALLVNRNVILNDLSPAAIHIAQNYCIPVNADNLRSAYLKIIQNSQNEFEWLYGTECDRCGGPATIQYTIWSDEVECQRCSEPLVLWELAIDNASGKVKEAFCCPNCGRLQTKKDTIWLRAVPIITNYKCNHCKPSQAEHKTTEKEKFRIHEIERIDIPYWYPTTPFDESWEMWRAVHKTRGITDVSKFYTHRNLWALSNLWDAAIGVEDSRIREELRFILTSFSQKHATVMTAIILKGGSHPVLTGNQPGTLYVPSFSAEKNLMVVLERKAKDTFDFINQKMSQYKGKVSLRTGSATSIADIPNDTVDYIFTDPPFGSNIFYADCNLIWEAWLGQFTDQTNEAVVHVKHKNRNVLTDYARLMTEAFREMNRVLKPGRWASVVFHNSDDRIWQTILDAVETAGFELAEVNSFDKEQLSFKGIRGAKGLEKVTNKDIVLNLQKPGLTINRQKNGTNVARNGENEARIAQRIADFLTTNPLPEKRTLQHFWNVVLYDMLTEGVVDVSMEKVGAILPHYFKQVDGRWYLRGETVAYGNVFDLNSDAGAISWLSAVLSSNPQTIGDLIPNWQSTTATLQGGDVEPDRLERLLEQNFWLDKRTNHWRLPTSTEREQMSAAQDISAQAHLRTIRRFLQGEADHKPNMRELAAWIQFTYNRGAYAETIALYDHLDES